MIDTSVTLEMLNKTGANTLSDNLAIKYVELSEDELKAQMPIDHRTVQQLGMMHGGASAALAEMTGRMAAYLSIDREKFFCVGQELKINHLKAVLGGKVTATATALYLGFQSHVWQIKTHDEAGDLVAFSTLTMAVLPLDQKMKARIGDIFKKLM
ncbi:MAG: hotdog fold thioesterase [Bacteroidetes bacterium]|nr:hotdog fold thioesterase [Bacteroidota bacterium]